MIFFSQCFKNIRIFFGKLRVVFNLCVPVLHKIKTIDYTTHLYQIIYVIEKLREKKHNRPQKLVPKDLKGEKNNVFLFTWIYEYLYIYFLNYVAPVMTA